VTLADGGGTREVEVGVRGDSYTQITSGLAEGDRIELLQGSIGTTTNQNGQGQRQGQVPGQGPGQLPGAGVGAGGNRGR
jgi:macrolide-specific efflux system membrane fusion protein